MFGAGGGTSSYREVEDTDVVVLWGSNARDAHPIFFHHVLKAVHRGAKLFVVDPRRTSTAQWADHWLGLDVGTDIALANTVAREIIHAGLVHERFVDQATTGFDELAASVEPWTLERGEQETGVPAEAIRELAHAYASADRAQLCWTLGITEHHNAVDNVLALINLALLTGHVGRYGSGLNPLRGQNNVQGGGDMGAIPNRLPGFQDILDDDLRQTFEQAWGCTLPGQVRLAPVRHVRGHGSRRPPGAVRAGREPGPERGRRRPRPPPAGRPRPPRGAGHLPDQDRRDGRRRAAGRPRRGARATAPSPTASAGCSWSARPSIRRATPATTSGSSWRSPAGWATTGTTTAPRGSGTRCAPCRRCTGACRTRRLEELGGIQWPCYHDDRLEPSYLHGRLWADDPAERGRLAPLSVVQHELPVDELSDEFPLRLTTGRRLDSYNTGVQTSGYASPLRAGETIDVSPEDARRLGFAEGDPARVISRRGEVLAPVRVDPGLRPGLAFMTMHFPDEVDTNVLTIEAVDPKSGTAEFKATAIRLEKVPG